MVFHFTPPAEGVRGRRPAAPPQAGQSDSKLGETTMAADNYKHARKEMETLLKVEGGVPLQDRKQQAKKEMLDKLNKAGEAGTHVGAGEGGLPPGVTEETLHGAGTSAEEMMKTLTEKAGLEYRDINEYDLSDPQKVRRLTSYLLSSTCRERRIFPVDEYESEETGRPVLVVAISDPMDITVIDDLRLMLPEHDLEPVVCNEDDIVDMINTHYGVADEDLEEVIGTLESEEGETESDASRRGEVEISMEDVANNPPVIKLVNLLLMQAIKDRASDIHVEPFGGMLRIRYRVDGLLREIPSPPKSLQLGMLSRLKVMADMNISENRKPQDGRIRLNVEGREVDLRVACVPTVHGESIVMRVLDKSTMMIGVSDLGMQQEVLAPYLKRARKPNGIILVTGPTGCGKTTTLYATLQEVFDPGSKFITTEDPVEFELPGVVQVNINSKVGLTFARCLRSILRQDPDVILVGEIRDVETAQIAIQAALTGHLVFSTLHTNSAAATITRMIDMGMEPFLLTSTLEAVVGQRLIRTICPNCKAPYRPSDEDLFDFGVSHDEVSDIDFFKGRGCEDCNYTGYKGRLGIFEMMEVTEPIKELILSRASTDDIHAMAVHEGMITMRQDGWLKICLGVTTFEEVARNTIPETEESIKAEMESVRKSLAMIERIEKERAAEEYGALEGDEEEESQGVIQVDEGKETK